MIELSYPILIYDNLCYSCTRMARLANSLAKNKCLVVGHYTPLGKEIKRQVFPKDYDGFEMSWFLIDGQAFGGRAGLFRLAKYILFEPKNGSFPQNEFNLAECNSDCKAIKGVFLRSNSILRMHKKFALSHN